MLCEKDFVVFDVLMKSIKTNFRVLVDSIIDVLGILRCDRIVPIYNNLVYQGTCTYSVTGVTWIWASLLVISACAFIMITLRSAMQETVFFSSESDGTEDGLDKGVPQEEGFEADENGIIQENDYETYDAAEPFQASEGAFQDDQASNLEDSDDADRYQQAG